jgi:hypothetical protein
MLYILVVSLVLLGACWYRMYPVEHRLRQEREQRDLAADLLSRAYRAHRS